YYAVDWLSRKTRFAESTLIESMKKFPVAISDDDYITAETTNNLLYVLVRNRYLNFRNNQYHVVWSKKRPPVSRFVNRRPATRTTGRLRTGADRPAEKTRGLVTPKGTSLFDVPASEPTMFLASPDADNTIAAGTEPLVRPASGDAQTQGLSAPSGPAGLRSAPAQTQLLKSEAAAQGQGATLDKPSTGMPKGVSSERSRIFVSYSHADRKWLEKLHLHLKPIERAGKLELWDDTRIKVGARWRRDIQEAISSARVAILLVSANFLASDFIAKDELPPLLASSENQGTIIMALILSPSMFMQTTLSQFQSFNPPSRPMSSMDEHQQEELLVQVAEAIKEAFCA
ncbi:MAG: toll/interleukin-1 receptor domain-containing protein, partial [Blastocatellia bacterium]